MMRRRIFILALTVFLVLSIFNIIPFNVSASDNITVGPGGPPTYDFDNINDAIASANSSDTILVYGGPYEENIIIGESISLISNNGASSTTIKSANANIVTIEINANNVNISGFKIENLGGSYSCIKLNSVSNCLIEDNVIKNSNQGNGVYLISSSSNTIQGNTIESNYIGIYFSNSDSNTIKNNKIQNNENYGMFLDSISTGNIIYLNDFSHINGNNTRDQGSNNWDYNSQGNYWDDYNDYDSNGDGIGDNPYVIEGSGNQDNYPLGDFLSSNEQPVAKIDSISPNPAVEGETVYFNGQGSDDGSILAWEWKSNGVVINTSGDFSKSDFSAGTYTISFRVQDDDDNWSPTVERTLVINSPNQIPVAYILDPTTTVTKYYGEDITFLGDWSDDGEVLEFSWRSDVDGVLSESIQFTKNDLTVEQHTIYFKVRDNYGEWSSETSIAVTILSDPSNNPPIADAGGHYIGYVNQSITFDGSGSYDPDDGDNITIYQWDFGDGSNGEGVSPGHTYTSEGNYTVELTVIDGHDEQNKNTTYANISIQSNGQNGNAEENGESPGFEIIFVVIASVIVLFWIKKRKGS